MNYTCFPTDFSNFSFLSLIKLLNYFITYQLRTTETQTENVNL
jgi:hypothetical protein